MITNGEIDQVLRNRCSKIKEGIESVEEYQKFLHDWLIKTAADLSIAAEVEQHQQFLVGIISDSLVIRNHDTTRQVKFPIADFVEKNGFVIPDEKVIAARLIYGMDVLGPGERYDKVYKTASV